MKLEIHKKLASKVSFEFADTPLDEAVSFLNSLAKVNVILDPKVFADGRGKKPITLRGQDVTIEEALMSIARLTKLDYDLRGQGVPAVVITYPHEEPWEIEIRKTLERKISFEFNDMPFDGAIGFLREHTGLTMIVDSKVLAAKRGTITLRVTDMHASVALEWMLRLADLDYTLKDKAVFISTRPELQDHQKIDPAVNVVPEQTKPKDAQPDEF